MYYHNNANINSTITQIANEKHKLMEEFMSGNWDFSSSWDSFLKTDHTKILEFSLSFENLNKSSISLWLSISQI